MSAAQLKNLVVDDVHPIRNLFRMGLKMRGFQVPC
jgi:hypothetical protein